MWTEKRETGKVIVRAFESSSGEQERRLRKAGEKKNRWRGKKAGFKCQDPEKTSAALRIFIEGNRIGQSVRTGEEKRGVKRKKGGFCISREKGRGEGGGDSSAYRAGCSLCIATTEDQERVPLREGGACALSGLRRNKKKRKKTNKINSGNSKGQFREGKVWLAVSASGMKTQGKKRLCIKRQRLSFNTRASQDKVRKKRGRGRLQVG